MTNNKYDGCIIGGVFGLAIMAGILGIVVEVAKGVAWIRWAF